MEREIDSVTSKIVSFFVKYAFWRENNSWMVRATVVKVMPIDKDQMIFQSGSNFGHEFLLPSWNSFRVEIPFQIGKRARYPIFAKKKGKLDWRELFIVESIETHYAVM